MLSRKSLFHICLLITYIDANFKESIASKDEAYKLKSERRRCSYKLRRLWQNDISSFPFAASPTVADIDGDGGLDIIAAPFGETLSVIEGEMGKHLHDTNWPQHNLDRSIHSSPIQYDIDGDGLLDVLFITSQAEGLFYTNRGHFLQQFTFQLSPAYVEPDWFSGTSSVDHKIIHQFVSSKHNAKLVAVDSHVLSTPILHDMRYLVIPVSYFFSSHDYELSEPSGPWGKADNRDKYYVTAFVMLDLKKLSLAKMLDREHQETAETYTTTVFLELTKVPSYLLWSPTVVDVDGKFGPVEVIIGTETGNLYIVSIEGKHRKGFPRRLSPLSGRVSAADVTSDPGLELIVIESNGKVNCLDGISGQILWTSQIKGSVFAGSRIVDVNIDGQMDVVVANNEGDVYALNGENGFVLPNYPFKTGKRINGNVLITKFNLLSGHFDLMFVSDDGLLHILASDHSCYVSMSLGETSLVDIISHDLVLMNRGMEYLVSTADGSVICLGSGVETPIDELIPLEFRLNWQRLSSITDTGFTFVQRKSVMMIEERSRNLKEVTGSSFNLYCLLFSESKESFFLKVYMGSEVVTELDQVTSGTNPVTVQVQTPEQPGQAQITVAISNKHGFISTDSIALKFNQMILLDLQWLILAPFFAMVIILLVNHGFPAKDLLPVTFPSKSK